MQIKFSKEEEIRIDIFLKDELNISRSKAQLMIDSELVLVNSNIIHKNYILQNGDIIDYQELETKEIDLKPENLNLDIYYEDEYLAVVYKEKGVVVHPCESTKDNTLVNGLLYQLDNLSGINGEFRPGIVHRIDKDTTGLLMVAKCDEAHKALSEDLKNKTIKRVYYALVEGVINENDGIINAPIGRDPKNRLKNAVVKDGKEAITTFHVIERFKNKTYIECVLKTGRTHQIRVHMSYIGHPVYGDPLYANLSDGTKYGQFLHAGVIGFEHPIKHEWMEFKAPLPEYFEEELKRLRK